mmetsp:Transcript_44163/g.91283  ORF Transcript_44163/g.91283 Transcript_44163/m.91283 type:complete len:131 (+) Transcript_44163:71-463(+)
MRSHPGMIFSRSLPTGRNRRWNARRSHCCAMWTCNGSTPSSPMHAPFKLAGVFHVGVQVGDEEWAFGATRRGTGVWRQKPRSTEQHHFRQSIVIWRTLVKVHRLLKTRRRSTAHPISRINCCRMRRRKRT